MFNEILTGKASLEPNPPPAGPYREAATLPPLKHACVACRQIYEAPAGSVPGRCATCHVAMVEANAQQSAAAFHAGQDHARRAEGSQRMFRMFLLAVVGIGLGLFRYGMHSAQREDAARAAGYHSYSQYESERDAVYPTDEYSYRAHELADDMCRCKDLACARNTMAQFTRHLRSGTPGDDKSRESVDQDSARLADCEAQFENDR